MFECFNQSVNIHVILLPLDCTGLGVQEFNILEDDKTSNIGRLKFPLKLVIN